MHTHVHELIGSIYLDMTECKIWCILTPHLGLALPFLDPGEDAAAFQNKMDGYQFPNSGSAKASIHQHPAACSLIALQNTELPGK